MTLDSDEKERENISSYVHLNYPCRREVSSCRSQPPALVRIWFSRALRFVPPASFTFLFPLSLQS